MIVMKFGGSSVESAEAIARVAAIVKERVAEQPVVVVSAMGTTTNLLLAAAEAAALRDHTLAVAILDRLRKYTLDIARDVVARNDYETAGSMVGSHFQELSAFVDELVEIGEFPPQYVDLISSYGERISSKLVAWAFQKAGLDSVHVDAREIVITDRRHTQAAPLYSRTYARCEATLAPLALAGKIAVLGGFIGSTQDGFTTTLGRGGSDFSAAIIGAGIGASEIQIWTDVDGMLTTDPRIVSGGHRIRTISFAEAAELAYFGAKVLHPATVVPAVEKNIPVRILNSRNPAGPGTMIVGQSVPSRNVVKSIACKRGITLVNIQSLRMLMAHGFLHRIFETFDRLHTAVDVVSTSEVSVSLTIDNTTSLDEIVAELSTFADVTVESNLAIVCMVGEGLKRTPGVAARAFDALRDVNLHMISQGASLLNLSVVIEEAALEQAVASLHNRFFAELDPEVFA